MNHLDRRALLTKVGAAASAIAVPSLMLPRAALATSAIPHHVFPGPSLPASAWTYLPNCLNTRRNIYVAFKPSGYASDFYLTDQSGEYVVTLFRNTTDDICDLYSADVNTGKETLVKSWSSNNRETPVINGPWVLTVAGAIIVTSSSVIHRNWAGWVKFKLPTDQGVGYAVYAKYWVWDVLKSSWIVRSVELIDTHGNVNAAANTFHAAYTNIANLLTNRFNSMLTYATAYTVADIVLFAAFANAGVGRLTATTLAAISVLGYAGYDVYKAATGYCETLYGQINSSAGTVLVPGELPS